MDSGVMVETPKIMGRWNKIRVIALHGKGSNSDITSLQMDNLGLNSDEFEVVCVNGPFSSSAPGIGLKPLSDLRLENFYSWFPEDDSDSKGYLDAICSSVEKVLSAINDYGGFNVIYGFSQGAGIAKLVNEIYLNEELLFEINRRGNVEIPKKRVDNLLFECGIFACASNAFFEEQHKLKPSLHNFNAKTSSFFSLHIIGKYDELKNSSEEFFRSMPPDKSIVRYFDGGHEIPSNNDEIKPLLSDIKDFITSAEPKFVLDTDKKSSHQVWYKSCSFSEFSVDEKLQIANVRISDDITEKTISNILLAQPENSPLFRLARSTTDIYTSYGQMYDFCSMGGEGDLRRLGVNPGDAVAYLAPPGGGAVSAAAFLTIASQACAVPFNASMTQQDAMLALEQYNVQHLILFNHVQSVGVISAFEAYAEQNNVGLHYAEQSDNDSPGLFRFKSSLKNFSQLTPLKTKAKDHCLLLRTSGTTSVPKVVPLRQADLVINAQILADGLGIDSNDVTYSVMPLDHIGGLSASILCSIAAGSSITCDDLYTPEGMIEALSISNPQPTWYSSVPTIHNATIRHLTSDTERYLDEEGVWIGHNLRFVRSGAAALKETDKEKLEHTLGCQVIPTYSMSELMPICQPVKTPDGWDQFPESVGVPVTASMAIVNPSTLQALPFGQEGEVAISGPTVFSGYRDNNEANRESRFLMQSKGAESWQDWFLTGDLGEMSQNGSLSLKGRIKELIKRGGEQISPAEVESVLVRSPSVNIAVCFSVPSEIYGEEVGCAIVLDPDNSDFNSESEAISSLRAHLKAQDFSLFKSPSVWKFIRNEDLPRTTSGKLIRKGLFEVLSNTKSALASANQQSPKPLDNEYSKPSKSGFDDPIDGSIALSQDKPNVDWAALAGFRFLLACYVMFMHIGSNESWDAFSNLRQFPWHVHAFFTLSGFSLAIIMPSLIRRKMSFISARILGMYPLYGLALLLAIGNLVVSCNPSTFISQFNWSPLLNSSDQMFCQGTPLIEGNWLTNFLMTIGIHITGLQATPLWGASWFLGFYLWFISMFFQCLIIFPVMYNYLYKHRGRTAHLLGITAVGLIANIVIVMGFWYGYAIDATGYGLFDVITGMRLEPTSIQVETAGKDNAIILGFYLFSPFWMVYFIAGMCAAFIFDSVRPNEWRNSKIWGYIADAITIFIVAISVAHIAQGYAPYGEEVVKVSVDTFFMRPDAANSHADPSVVNRIWDNIYGRLFAPITLLWIFAISTGQGWTAKILRFNPISQSLAPTAYACFLFHQLVGQWYYAATRQGEWWNWWNHQKTFYWFSPQPVPVEWYEYFYVVGLVVIFSKVVQSFEPMIRKLASTFILSIRRIFSDNTHVTKEQNIQTKVLTIVERVTGMEIQPHWSLEECGLASLGVVQFTATLEAELSTDLYKVSLNVSEVIAAKDIAKIAELAEAAISQAQESCEQQIGIGNRQTA
ncbi:AMP-binding protein [Microbulbifer sp. SSSA002]|uniref:AMP-binding protein n=1 Tax=Microbulbifer sp. SSSA002 TaxID=3243376 RepID=UPI00403A430F